MSKRPLIWTIRFDHILPFTHVSLVEALASGGFETQLVIPRSLPYTTVGARRVPLQFVRWYVRLPLAWRVLGSQFFAIAKPIAAPASRDVHYSVCRVR